METGNRLPFSLGTEPAAKPQNGEGLQPVDTQGERIPLTYEPYFCPADQDPYALVEWKKFHPILRNAEGNVLFEQKDVVAPAFWSERAVRVVAQKYFRGQRGTPQRESSVKQLVGRVVATIQDWAHEQGYFKTRNDVRAFCNDLVYLILTQHGTFNSPVWFNLGVEGVPQQASACFIQSVDDNLESIAALQVSETLVFKRGSGSGTNFSNLRSRKERLSSGGVPSGPVSFMSGLDAWGGVIKSGGTTRRAAKMCILDVGHPDILEFINCKLIEEKKAHALIATGYDAHFDVENGAYDSIKFQNANHSVRIPDAFMRKLEYALANPNEEVTWDLIAVTSGEVVERVPIKAIWDAICQAAWQCGDPGLQFDSTHNAWHTCPSDGRLTATNPCQPGFAPVMTPQGLRTFDDIQEGDVIWSGSEWTFVEKKWRTGVKEVFRYQTRAGAFLGTDQHRIVQNGEKIEVRHAETIDITAGPQASIETLDQQDVIDGLMFGDGYPVYANDGANIYPVLCVGDNDQCYFESEVASFINPIPYDVKRHRVEHTTLQPNEMPRMYLRQVPSRFRQGTHTKVRGFLRGLYSANGSVVSTRVTLKTSSFDVVDAVQQMLSFLGIRSYYTINKEKDVTFANGTYMCRQNYDLNISTDRGIFRDLVGFIHPDKTARLDAACERSVNIKRTKTSYEIVSVKSLGEMPVWDIHVRADTHTYWTGGLLVSNCGEYSFLNDTSCNLASLNLLKFRRPNGNFDWERFRKAVHTFILAQEALVEKAHYPTDKLTEQTKKYHTLGLGYTNLGAYLMACGLPYDSAEGRQHAAHITSEMTGTAYRTSALLSLAVGPFEAFQRNRPAIMEVVKQHRDAAEEQGLSTTMWDDALALGDRAGFRNAQVSVLAPTGTISFMMDCDTTGCEPEVSLYKVKHLVGGGMEVMENRIVDMALQSLDYGEEQRSLLLKYLARHQTLEGSSLAEEHLPVFDCSIPSKGDRVLSLDAHLKMTATLQPFISGSISKTMNVPNNTSVETMGQAYFDAWKLGIKSVTVYRDGCKKSQPLQTTTQQQTEVGPVRRKLSDHQMNMHRIKLKFGNVKGYMLVTPYEDSGLPGELFIKLAKEGSTISGLVDGWAQAMSYCLQYGVPLETLVEKFSNTKFEPSGFSSDADIRSATSIYDAVMRKLAAVFLNGENANGKTAEEIAEISANGSPVALDAPICNDCGTLMTRTGANCHSCPSCGSSSGCG